jgi:two-component system nitrogen regulation sensor histidine kinase NtrY
MVMDNGTGIAPETRKRLFEPYFTSKAKGSGLGLAIVKKMVEENGGKVSLVNRSEIWAEQSHGAVAVVEFAKLGNASDNLKPMEINQSIHG